MACYILSDNTRVYAVEEAQYGNAAAMTNAQRIPFLDCQLSEQVERPRRMERSGGRTFVGWPRSPRRRANYEIRSVMVEYDAASGYPPQDAMIAAALGGERLAYAGGTLGAGSTTTQLEFASAHNLSADQAVVVGNEIRFVDAIPSATTAVLNAPLTRIPEAGEAVHAAVTYRLGESLPGVTLYEYRDPQEAVHRMASGAIVDAMRIDINDDYHEFLFRGPVAALHSSATFQSGGAGLVSFPTESYDPTVRFRPVAGHLGQAYVGSAAAQMGTLTRAAVTLINDVAMRDREFGTAAQTCAAPGRRRVESTLEMYPTSDGYSLEVFEQASVETPLKLMLQLGEERGGLCGIYLKSVVGESPRMDLSQTRLKWKFESMRAAGTMDDELVIAFG